MFYTFGEVCVSLGNNFGGGVEKIDNPHDSLYQYEI
jgi:hypothetical protein